MKQYLFSLLLVVALAGCDDRGAVTNDQPTPPPPGPVDGDKPPADETTTPKPVSQDVHGKWLLVDSQIDGLPYTAENLAKPLYFCDAEQTMTVGQLKEFLCQTCQKRTEVYDKVRETFQIINSNETLEGTYSLDSTPGILSLRGDWMKKESKGNYSVHYKMVEEGSGEAVVRKMFARGVNECWFNVAYSGQNRTGTRHPVWWIFKYCGDVNSQCPK